MPNSHREFEIRSRSYQASPATTPMANRVADGQTPDLNVTKKKSKAKKVSSFFSRRDNTSTKTNPDDIDNSENERIIHNPLNFQQQDQEDDDDNYGHENEHVHLNDNGQMNEINDDDESDDSDDLFDRLSSSPSIHEDEIDFSFVYALKTFVATEKGQANAVKGDAMILLNDSNSYWWLVRLTKDSTVGFLPAENIETPSERLARLNKYRNGDAVAPTKEDEESIPGSSFSSLSDSLKPSFMLKKSSKQNNNNKKSTKSVMFNGNPTYVSASEYEYSTGDEASDSSELAMGDVSDLEEEIEEREDEEKDEEKDEEQEEENEEERIDKTKQLQEFNNDIDDTISISSDDPELIPLKTSTPQSMSALFSPSSSMDLQTELNPVQDQNLSETETQALFVPKTRGSVKTNPGTNNFNSKVIEPLSTKNSPAEHQKLGSTINTSHTAYDISPLSPLKIQNLQNTTSNSAPTAPNGPLPETSKKPRRQISNSSFFSKLKKNRERDGSNDRNSIDSSVSLEIFHVRKFSNNSNSEMYPIATSPPSPELDREAMLQHTPTSPNMTTNRSNSLAGFFRKRISSRDRPTSVTSSPAFNVDPLGLDTHTIPPIGKSRFDKLSVNTRSESVNMAPTEEDLNESHPSQISLQSTSTLTTNDASTDNMMKPMSLNEMEEEKEEEKEKEEEEEEEEYNDSLSALRPNQEHFDSDAESSLMMDSPILWNPPDAFKSNSMTSTTSSMWSGVSSQVHSYKMGSSMAGSPLLNSSVIHSTGGVVVASSSSSLHRSKSLALSNNNFDDGGLVRQISLNRVQKNISALKHMASIASFHAEIDQTNNNHNIDHDNKEIEPIDRLSGTEDENNNNNNNDNQESNEPVLKSESLETHNEMGAIDQIDQSKETREVKKNSNSAEDDSSSINDDTVIIHTPPIIPRNIQDHDRNSLVSNQSFDYTKVAIASTSTLASDGDHDVYNPPVTMTSPYSVQTSLESLHNVKPRTVILHPDIVPIFQASSDKLNELSNRLDVLLRNI